MTTHHTQKMRAHVRYAAITGLAFGASGRTPRCRGQLPCGRLRLTAGASARREDLVRLPYVKPMRRDRTPVRDWLALMEQTHGSAVQRGRS